jgi:diguanylate cyclase (GGDEF)-like protein
MWVRGQVQRVRSIFLKSTLVAVGATLASLLIVATIVPMLGGVVDGNAWLMTVVCPLATAWPASAFTFWQGTKLRRAHEALSAAHAELAETHRLLAEKASRDPMTGFLNRESFFAVLDGSRRKSDRGALLLIDADHFKRINDGFGHLVGDEALVAIAAAIGRGVRGGDTIGRIGGEEFAVFLPGAGDGDAARVAERIRQEVEAIRFLPAGHGAVPLTVSIGGAPCASDAGVSDLMRIADRRLYEAKRRGRNRAILGQDMPAAA